MKATKLADKIWYFEDIISNPMEIIDGLDEWKPVARQEYMETAIKPTYSFLKATENATFRVLDYWYRENPDLTWYDYKLLKDTAYYRRGAGNGYGPHADYAANPDGSYEEVAATILGYFADPDDYEGGEIYFDDYDIYIKPKQGSMIIFGHQVQHGVTPVTSGTRIISSQFLVLEKDYWKIMQMDPDKVTKEDRIRLRTESPQYEEKNGNVQGR